MTRAERVLGVDIGGSASRAWLAEGDSVVARASAPSASLTTTGPERAGAVIEALLAELGLGGANGRAQVAAVCVGSAGSGGESADWWIRERFRALVRGRSEERVLVVNDARLVLAAESLSSGIALVAGTGSTALGVDGDRQVRVGGFGYMLGDEGSGYWVVREALRRLCLRRQREEPLGALGASVLDGLGVHELSEAVQLFHEHQAPARWAAMAPAVLGSGDDVAGEILTEASEALGDLVKEAADLLGSTLPLPVVVAGGLITNDEELFGQTVAAICRRLPGCDVRRAAGPPVAGAVRLARSLV